MVSERAAAHTLLKGVEMVDIVEKFTRAERQEFFAGLPWVTRLKKSKEHCDGIKWDTVAMKDIYSYGPRNNRLPARGIQDKSRCKNKGWWKFRALRLRGAWARPAKSGTYCWSHFIQQCWSIPEEEDRLKKAWTNRKKDTT